MMNLKPLIRQNASMWLVFIFGFAALCALIFLGLGLNQSSSIAVTVLACLAVAAGYAAARPQNLRIFQPSYPIAKDVLEDLPVAVLILSPSGIVVDANQAIEAVMGCSPNDVIGEDFSKFLATRVDKVRQEISQLRVSSDVANDIPQCFRLAAADGATKVVEMVQTNIKSKGEVWSSVVLTDVSHFNASASLIVSLEAQLARANAELDQFAYVASHDLKAPLRVIDNTSQWLAEDLTPHLTDDTRETLAMLRGRVQRMERLLNALLEHSRVGREEPNTEPVSGKILASLLASNFEKNESFRVSFDDRFLQSNIPREPLATILGNLIDNSIRHHHRGEGKVHVTLATGDQTMTFRVTDDGPGIPEQYHQKVFEVFQTLTRRDEFDSNGMGLAIARKHAQLHGGHIFVEENQSAGTCVRVEWPIPGTSEFKKEIAS